MDAQLVTVSSKGQVAIPIEMRKKMSIQTGDKLVAYSSGDYIMFKVLRLPSFEEFQAALDEAQDWATSFGLTEADVDATIKSVRARKKTK